MLSPSTSLRAGYTKNARLTNLLLSLYVSMPKKSLISSDCIEMHCKTDFLVVIFALSLDATFLYAMISGFAGIGLIFFVGL